jgi:hypothetical protein
MDRHYLSVYSVNRTVAYAGHASDAFFLVDKGGFFLFPVYSACGAILKAYAAFFASFTVHHEPYKGLAAFGRTPFFKYVGLVFIPEILERG